MILAAQLSILIGVIALLLGFAIASIAVQKNNEGWTKTGCDVAFRGIIIMVVADVVLMLANLLK